MNELQIFSYEGNEVRTVEVQGEPWWVLKDVCGVLGISNTSDTAKRLDEDDKGIAQIDTLGGEQKLAIINESGLYTVLLRSDKPQAKPFRKWVTAEVLPSIRKHGAYMTSQTIEAALLNPDTIIQLATNLKAEQEKNRALQLETSMQKQVIGELKPVADYVSRILNNKGLVTITQIAKDYGMSGQAMNKLLNRFGVQYKQGDQWLLYAKYHAKGYTHSQTIDIVRSDGTPDIDMHTKWTQKGRLFLYELLKKRQVLPVIER